VNCLQAAHIKKRSEYRDIERLELSNLMLACTFGCDHLFGLGSIYVDTDGLVQRAVGRRLTPALDSVIAVLEKRSCEAHSEKSEQYSAWHRSHLPA